MRGDKKLDKRFINALEVCVGGGAGDFTDS